MPIRAIASARLTQPRAEWLLVAVLSAVLVAVAYLPYALAYSAPGDYVFSGILFNPADGNSYLAKMREGWRGQWLFTLPYTAEPGLGAFIFTYYLLLGHLARWTGAGLDAVYHLARVAGALALLLSAYAFIARFFDSGRARLGVWALFALGSGLGWLALPFGAFPSDFWVAEAFPFLAIVSNAHFALATALLLWLHVLIVPALARFRPTLARLALVALLTTALAQVQPLALVNLGLILAGYFTAQRLLGAAARPNAPNVANTSLPSVAVYTAFAAPWVIYDAALTWTHPVLAQWNAQNLTPSPAIWEALLSGGIPLLLAIAGVVAAARRRNPCDLLLLAWLIVTGLALYAPFSLQRRLSLGLWMPISILAGYGVRDALWPRLRPRLRSFVVASVGLLALPTNLIVYAALLGAVAAREQAVFYSRAEAAALAWLAGNAPGAIVSAAPELALFIPARTDARVIYGHPFETVEAETRKAAVEAFYSGQLEADAFVRDYAVDYVVYGPRERELSDTALVLDWPVAYDGGEVVIYAP